MTTKPKMKGLFKGFKYISHIFEEEKDDGIQIGFPTDVKHVAHIGWDGPTAVDNPSWMKEFGSSTQSAPLGPPIGDTIGEPEIKWVSEDSSTRRSSKPVDSPGQDQPDVPKTSRRHHSADNNPNESSPKKKDSTTKPRSRRNHSKDSSEGSVKSNTNQQESNQSCDLPPPNIPDPAKKSRRKKSKELGGGSRGGEGSTRSKTKSTSCGDTGPDKESMMKNPESQLDPIPTT